MSNQKTSLEQFRDLKISKNDLLRLIPKGSKVETPVIVNSKQVINILTKYQKKVINPIELLDWVNIIWFSDWFQYEENQSDCIASVMSELEELDEEGKKLDSLKLARFINALENNIEVYVDEMN